MKAFLISCYNRLHHKGQLKCSMEIIAVLVLSLVPLSAQVILQQREMACRMERVNGVCACSRYTVACNSLKRPLTAFPSRIVKTVKYLELKKNAIAKIEEDDFLHLEFLAIILLQNNSIEYIHPNAFRNLYKLNTLDLSNNKLQRVDPSGRTFQHLPSLKLLNLHSNRTMEINKYSFLTMVANSERITVNITWIHCDCGVWALRSWERSLLHDNISMTTSLCKNDDKGRSYKEVEASVFGVCNGMQELSENEHKVQSRVERDTDEDGTEADEEEDKSGDGSGYESKDNSGEGSGYETIKSYATRDDIFSETISCPVCENESTNHGCRLKGTQICDGYKTMCRKTVIWHGSDMVMSISSSCSNYHECLKEEAKNAKTCGINYLDEDVICNFCCRNSTCGADLMEGRTKDFTLSLIYDRSNFSYEKSMVDKGSSSFTKEESRIAKGMRHHFHNLIGGVDVYLDHLIQLPIGIIRVLLRLEVTTLNTATKEIVIRNITDNLLNSSLDGFSFLYKENIVLGSLDVTSHSKDFLQCPDTFSNDKDKGYIIWNSSPIGLYSKPCPNNDIRRFRHFHNAYRSCLKTSDGSVVWGETDYSFCSNKKEEPLTPENAKTVSFMLKNVTDNLVNVTFDMLDNTVKRLEQYRNETLLKLPDVVTNTVTSLSNLMNIDRETLREIELKDSISKRVLDIIDYISEKAPLKDGKLIEVAPNLVIVAQTVNANETRDLVLTADNDNVGGFNASTVSLVFSNGNDSQHRSRSSMVIPMLAIIGSASLSAGKNNTNINISRVTFALHESDILFNAMKYRNSQVSQTNTTQTSGCEKNNSIDCQIQNASPLTSKINSQVISARVPGVSIIENLTENITMRFVHSDSNYTRNPRCVFWKENLANNNEGEWSDEGCGLIETNSNETICACNHLTNFALFMDVYQSGSSVSELDQKILSIISFVGCGISLCALILTLLTYTLIRKVSQRRNSDSKKLRKLRRDNPSKILINLCLALLLSNLIFLVGMRNYTFDNTASCKVVAVLMHYFLLASLTWMAVEAFYMYLALILVFKTYFPHFILKCSLVGWGVPLVIVIITLGINATENYGLINNSLCWLRNPAFYSAFVGPVCFILLINCFAFGLVIRQLFCISRKELNITDRNSTIQHLRGAVGVVVLLGLTWLFAIFAIGQANVVFYYFFAVFNSLQGLFIFIFYCLLKKDTALSWKILLPCFEEYGETSKSSSNSKAVTKTKTASHHLVNKRNTHSRSDSSTFLANTVSASSTLIDTTKDSYFTSVTNNHPDDSSEDCDTTINAETLAGTADFKIKLSPILIPEEQEENPISGTYKLTTYTIKDGKSSTDFNSSTEHSYKESATKNLSKDQKPSPSDSQLTISKSPTTFSKGLLPTSLTTETNLNLESQKGNDSPTLLSPKASGEVDQSSHSKVSDTILKFEQQDSDEASIIITHF